MDSAIQSRVVGQMVEESISLMSIIEDLVLVKVFVVEEVVELMEEEAVIITIQIWGMILLLYLLLVLLLLLTNLTAAWAYTDVNGCQPGQ